MSERDRYILAEVPSNLKPRAVALLCTMRAGSWSTARALQRRIGDRDLTSTLLLLRDADSLNLIMYADGLYTLAFTGRAWLVQNGLL